MAMSSSSDGRRNLVCSVHAGPSMAFAGAAVSMIIVATKVWLPRQNFCRNKIMFCRDKKTFFLFFFGLDKHKIKVKKKVKVCLSRQIIVATNVLWLKKYVCRDATSIRFSRQKTSCVASNTCFSLQTRVCRQNFCRDKNDTCASSRQWYFQSF